MKIPNFYHVALFSFAVVLSGCVSTENYTNKKSVISEPFISAEIEKTRLEGESERKRYLDPATKEQDPKFSFVINEGEDFRSAMTRFTKENDLNRLIIDLSSEAIRPSQIVVHRGGKYTANSLSELSGNLIKEMKLPLDSASFHEAIDGDKKSLVLTDRGYSPGLILNIHNVKAATLLENSREIAEFYGWSIANNAWQLPVEYSVKYPYPLVSKDLISAMLRLFERYPAQAQLMQSTKQVIFASRQQPIDM